MKADVVLGLQWGDEGKGKIVDVLAGKYPIVARFQGGANAGHSIHFGETSFVLHTVPSGVFHEGTTNIIGNGVVFDPVIFKKECKEIEALGIPVRERIALSKRANIILPTHKLLDAASESAMGKGKIGSTLKGIGPCYTDKTARRGLRIGDILQPDFKKKFENLKSIHISELNSFKGFRYDASEHEEEWMDAIEFLRNFRIIDGEYFLNNALAEGKSCLAEGAQGTLLDVDFGEYPFVTSSSTICAGACTGLGLPPKSIGTVYGIFKAYCTRVGSGPFPTELFDATGEELRKRGMEYGATTGRPRRTGWLDMVALKYAIMIDGVDELIMMKADVMDNLDTIKICTGYEVNGKVTDKMPFYTYSDIVPVYREFKGWKKSLKDIRKESDLPAEFLSYIDFIEKETHVPVKVVSLGPDRDQTLFR
ncbi:MAG: adenylosuccinate synthase [Bacteroidales bacterium]|jgi:adenylosuccinate synthase|nr:adenylosuccinate synthase [Bacteroidales bacterium]MCI2145307.1 adenylosuccinate synthase [Bacteroidales bacterium]